MLRCYAAAPLTSHTRIAKGRLSSRRIHRWGTGPEQWVKEAGHLLARGGRFVPRGRKGEWMDLKLTVTAWGCLLSISQGQHRKPGAPLKSGEATWVGTRAEEGPGKMWAATTEPSCLPGVKGYEEPGCGAMHTGMCVQRDVTEWHQGVQGWVLVCGYGLERGWVSLVLGLGVEVPEPNPSSLCGQAGFLECFLEPERASV